METKEFMNKRKARASWTTSRIMDVRTREVAVPISKESRRGDTSYPLGISGCNKSSNQVDIWRMERWNWFLAASKSRVCQGGRWGGCRGENPGKKKDARSISWGIYATIFYPARSRRRRTPRHGVGNTVSRRAVFQLAPPFHCAFGTRLEYPATLMRRRTPSKVLINSLRWLLEFGHAYNSETKLCVRPKWAMLRELKNGLLSCQCWWSSSLCARLVLTGHHISNVSIRANEGWCS